MKRVILALALTFLPCGAAWGVVLVDQNYDGADGLVPPIWVLDPTPGPTVTFETLNNELLYRWESEDFTLNRVASLDLTTGATATDVLRLSFDVWFGTMEGRTGPWTVTNNAPSFLVELGTANSGYHLRASAVGALIIQGGKGGTNPGGVRTWKAGYAGEEDVAAGVNVSDGQSYSFAITLDGSTSQQTLEVWNDSGVSQGSYTGPFILDPGLNNVNQATFSLPGRWNWMDGHFDNVKVELNPVDDVLVGDANLDGVVDDADLSLLLAHWGQDVTGDPDGGWGKGEFDGTAPVQDADLSLLLANWTAAGAVPEPASALVLLLGACALNRRRR